MGLEQVVGTWNANGQKNARTPPVIVNPDQTVKNHWICSGKTKSFLKG